MHHSSRNRSSPSRFLWLRYVRLIVKACNILQSDDLHSRSQLRLKFDRLNALTMFPGKRPITIRHCLGSKNKLWKTWLLGKKKDIPSVSKTMRLCTDPWGDNLMGHSPTLIMRQRCRTRSKNDWFPLQKGYRYGLLNNNFRLRPQFISSASFSI